jgi:hypothetical protein
MNEKQNAKRDPFSFPTATKTCGFVLRELQCYFAMLRMLNDASIKLQERRGSSSAPNPTTGHAIKVVFPRFDGARNTFIDVSARTFTHGTATA